MARHQLRQDGISPTNAPKRLVKRLKVYNCLLQSFKEANQSKNQVAEIAGGILRKYRAVRTLGQEIRMDRRTIIKGKASPRVRLPRTMMEIKEKIHNFLSRDDNSTLLAGKNDYKKIKKGNIQKRVLNDYLSNLWMKFKTEKSDVKVSLALFCRYRPKHIILTSFTSRKRCLCIYHQNLALKLKVIYHTAHPNPDLTIRNKTDDDILADMENTLGSFVTYHIWKRKTMPDGKKKMLCVQDTQTKHDFIETTKGEIQKFREHVMRVTNQYKQIQVLKEKLPVDHVAVHMDFAENYTCVNMDEVQSAYWNQELVSLHPTVIYYRDISSKLLHKSIVFTSDDVSHNSSAVMCIMDKMIPEIKELVPSVKCIHYISDSPVSQYRNRNIMFVIANFETIFGIPSATWTYLETGHGKVPCDGIGGTAKRNADAAVRHNKAIIQNADDFLEWATKDRETTIVYKNYKSKDVEEKREFLETVETVPIKNTLSVHAVCSMEPGNVTTRDVSCFCDDCFLSGLMLCQCTGWTTHTVGIYRNDQSFTTIQEGKVLAVFTDETGEPYYLLKATSSQETITKSETDEWGARYQKGLEIVRGLYYERCSYRLFKLNKKKKAIVPAQSILYATDMLATVKLTISQELHESVMEIIRQVLSSNEF